jgi:hypothetical protein
MSSTVSTRVQKLARLPLRGQGILLASALLLPLAAASLRMDGLLSTARAFRWLGRSLGMLGEGLPAHQCASLVNAVAALPFVRARCLTRSIVLSAMVGKRADSSLCVGVSLDGASDQFAAHAWVEIGGAPLAEAADVRERYSLLLQLP